MSVQEVINDLRSREQTSTVVRNLEYLDYPYRPIILDAKQALATGELEFFSTHSIYRPQNPFDIYSLGVSEVVIPLKDCYSAFAEVTMEGLNEALVRAEQGSPLREAFDREMEKYQAFLEENGDDRRYGRYAYFPGLGHLVHLPPEYWNLITLLTSNSTLLLDPEMQLGWEQVRGIFDKLVIASSGASVGSNIFNSILKATRFKRGKIADPRTYKPANGGRVFDLAYFDTVLSDAQIQRALENGTFVSNQKNKAYGVAERNHRTHADTAIWVYPEGVTDDNVNYFINGDEIEPAADKIIEESDSLDNKVRLLKKARESRKRVFQASDEGSTIELEIRPFDTEPDRSLVYGVNDDDLFEAHERTIREPGQDSFLRFLDKYVGPHYRETGEFGKIMTGELPKWFSSVPQLGATAIGAAAYLGDMIPRMALGYKYWERMTIDLRTGEMRHWGDLV